MPSRSIKAKALALPVSPAISVAEYRFLIWAGLAMLAFAGAASSTAFGGTDTAAAKPQQAGRVVSVIGTVLIRQDLDETGKAAGGKARAIKPGEQVFVGDTINTSSTGSMKLLLQDKSIIDLGPSSLFNVRDFQANGGADRNVDLKLPYGKIKVSVTQKLQGKGKFQLRTTAATMGVRGTSFAVQADMSEVGAKPADAKAGPLAGNAKPAPKPQVNLTVFDGAVAAAESSMRPDGSIDTKKEKKIEQQKATKAAAPEALLTAGKALVMEAPVQMPSGQGQMTVASAPKFSAITEATPQQMAMNKEMEVPVTAVAQFYGLPVEGKSDGKGGNGGGNANGEGKGERGLASNGGALGSGGGGGGIGAAAAGAAMGGAAITAEITNVVQTSMANVMKPEVLAAAFNPNTVSIPGKPSVQENALAAVQTQAPQTTNGLKRVRIKLVVQ